MRRLITAEAEVGRDVTHAIRTSKIITRYVLILINPKAAAVDYNVIIIMILVENTRIWKS